MAPDNKNLMVCFFRPKYKSFPSGSPSSLYSSIAHETSQGRAKLQLLFTAVSYIKRLKGGERNFNFSVGPSGLQALFSLLPVRGNYGTPLLVDFFLPLVLVRPSFILEIRQQYTHTYNMMCNSFSHLDLLLFSLPGPDATSATLGTSGGRLMPTSPPCRPTPVARHASASFPRACVGLEPPRLPA